MNITANGRAIFVPFLTTLKPTPAQLQPLKSLALFHCVSSFGRSDSSPGSCLSRSLLCAADALAGVTPLRSPALMTGDLQPFTGRKGRPGPAAAPEGLPSDPEGPQSAVGWGEGEERLSHDQHGKKTKHCVQVSSWFYDR